MVIGIGVIGVITTTLTLYLLGEKKKKTTTYKEKIINEVKEMLDNFEDLSSEDIDNIAKILKSLKK